MDILYVEKDKLGRAVAHLVLTAQELETVQESLQTTIQNTQHPGEANIQRMKALEPKFLEARNKARML